MSAPREWGHCSCGAPLVLISEKTHTSPAEWDCPVCSGVWDSLEAFERAMDMDEDTIGDMRYHRMRDEGEI